jgi:hypothetical protein
VCTLCCGDGAADVRPGGSACGVGLHFPPYGNGCVSGKCGAGNPRGEWIFRTFIHRIGALVPLGAAEGKGRKERIGK